MDPVTIAMLASSLFKMGKGFIDQGKAKKLAASAVRPEYNIQQPIIDNQALAESRAGQGLSDSSKQLFTTQQDRGLTASIDAILRTGGNANQVNEAYDSFNTGLSRLSLAEDEAKFRNMNMYLRANEQLAQEQDKAWQINKYAPYADQMKLASQNKQAADANVAGGISGLLGVGASYMKGLTNPTAGLAKTGTMSLDNASRLGSVGGSLGNLIGNFGASNTAFFGQHAGKLYDAGGKVGQLMAMLGLTSHTPSAEIAASLGDPTKLGYQGSQAYVTNDF